jgi:dienelactone hydrolase
LIYDKRGTGASTGDWTEVGFPELAADAVAAVERLAEHPEIDAAAIGLAGTSQGGWVAPLAASRSPRVAFLITFSGPLVTPAEEGHWDSLFSLRDAGYGEDVLADVEEILALWDETLRAGDWDTYREAIELVRQEPWFATARLPGEFSGPRAEWYRGIMDFDPVPLFERIEIPILAFFGLRDESIPAAKSAAILERIRDERGKRITVVCYPEADHALRRVQPRDGGFRWPALVPGFFERQADWILAITQGS